MNAYPATTDPTAVVGRRFGAYVIDAIVLAAIPIALFFATAGLIFYERPTTCAQIEAVEGELSSSETCADDLDVTINEDRHTAATFNTAAPFIAGGASLLYLVIVEWIIQAMTGATLGKAIFGIRTVNEAGHAPGLGKQFIRGVVWIVDSLCGGLVGGILILATKGHRRLGDMAAKTFVVRARDKGSPVIVPGLAGAAAVPATAYATSPYGSTPYTGDPYGGGPAPTSAPLAPTAPAAPTAPGHDWPTQVQATPTQATPTQATPGQATPGQAAPPSDGPQWDANRNAYIQWDPSGRRWLTYDDGAAAWKTIEGEQPPAPPS